MATSTYKPFPDEYWDSLMQSELARLELPENTKEKAEFEAYVKKLEQIFNEKEA